MEETALLNRIKEQFTREWVKSSNADKLHFVVVGPPGVGKTTIINTMAKRDNKQIESSDDLVNLRIFEKDNPERSRERFQGKNTLPYADERERNEITNRIWEEATKIAIDFAYAKDTYLDLDGKAWMLEEVRLYLKERDYITILLIPETFDEYFNLFARPDLAAAPEKQLEEQLQLINNKRLNVYVAMWKHSCKNYIEYQNQKARNELPDKCMNCEWYKYDYDCEYKTPKDTMWENFKKELNIEIWGKRIDFYNDNPDGTVSRRCGQTVTEIIQDIYKKIEDVKTERKEARQK
jgi:shikimate kinase